MEAKAVGKKRDRGGSDDVGEPVSKRQTTTIVDAEPSVKKGQAILYDEAKHGPIPLQQLDPNVQVIFKELETEIKTLEERTVDPEMIEETPEYYCSLYYKAESLAKKTWQRLEDQVKQHPHLARAVNDLGKPLAAILYAVFDADFLPEEGHSEVRQECVHLVEIWRNKCLLFLIERNPFCLIYKWQISATEKSYLLCTLALREENLKPLCSAVCDDFAWLFDHVKEEQFDPLIPLFGKMIKQHQENPDWVQQFFTEKYPQGLLTEHRRSIGSTLLHYFGAAFGTQECFDMELFNWFVQQNSQLLFQKNQAQQSPMHWMCKGLVTLLEARNLDQDVLPQRRQVVSCIEMVLDRYPSAMSLKDTNGDTPLHYICQGLNSMYERIEDLQNEYVALQRWSRFNLFDEHLKIMVESVELLMRRLPNLLHIPNNSRQYPIEIFRHDKELMLDLMISMIRAIYASDKRQDSFDKISSNGPNPFIVGIQRCIQEEAAYAHASVRLKKSKVLIEKMPKDSRKVIYGCWIEKQLNAIGAKITSIREVDLRKLKAQHRPSPVEA